MNNFIKQILSYLKKHLHDADLDWMIYLLTKRMEDPLVIKNIEKICDLLNEKDYFNNRNNHLKASFKELKALNKIKQLKVFWHRQRKLLLAVPQRKRNPQYPAPNLGGLVIPQHLRAKGEVCYGLDYVAARTYLVNCALKDPEITHILFIDDDILLPLNALDILTAANEPIVSANYVKKRFPRETNALQMVHSDKYGSMNVPIAPQLGDMTPVAASQGGLGATLIEIEVFKTLKEPWFEFIYNKDGTVFCGEDVKFYQNVILAGYSPKVIPGLVPLHVDFATRKYYGAPWDVNDNGQILSGKEKEFCYFECDPKDCVADDILDVFNKKGKKL